MRADVLYQSYDSPVNGGLFATGKILSRIKQRFWFPGLRASKTSILQNAFVALLVQRRGKFEKLSCKQFKHSIVAADILGHLTLAKQSQARYLSVISDLYTKCAVTVSLKVATTLVEDWIFKIGAPDTLHFTTDQGTNFNSEVMKGSCQLVLIDKTRTSPYHPQGYGEVERYNRVIADSISKYCAKKTARMGPLLAPRQFRVQNHRT